MHSKASEGDKSSNFFFQIKALNPITRSNKWHGTTPSRLHPFHWRVLGPNYDRVQLLSPIRTLWKLLATPILCANRRHKCDIPFLAVPFWRDNWSSPYGKKTCYRIKKQTYYFTPQVRTRSVSKRQRLDKIHTTTTKVHKRTLIKDGKRNTFCACVMM